MTEADDQLARRLQSIPTVGVILGAFVQENSDGSVQVDFGAGPTTCLSAGFFAPLPGQQVRCLRINDALVMMGPALPRSPIGTVTATGSPTLTVETSQGPMQLPYLTSYSAGVNDQVLIDWASGGIVIGVPSAIPAGSYDGGGGAVQQYTADFFAIDSGSYRSGSWWTNDVWQSTNNTGCWFYGTQIRDTIPDAAEIVSVQMWLPEFYNGFPAYPMELQGHALLDKSGAPSLLGSRAAVASGYGWRPIPNGHADQLKLGAWFGLGTAYDGYYKYQGIASDSWSGLLRIVWRV